MIEESIKINNSKDLGELLAKFYKEAIVNQTVKSVTDFVSNTEIVQINIYSLMNILYSMNDDNDKKEKWIIKEFEALDESSKLENRDKIKCLEDYFKITFNHIYLYLLSYDYLEKCTKRNEYSEGRKNIMSKCIYSLNKQTEKLTKSVAKEDLIELKACLKVLKNNSSEPLKFAYRFIRTLNLLRDQLTPLLYKF